MAASVLREDASARQSSGGEEFTETITPLNAEANANGAVQEPQSAIESGTKCQECRVAILDREALEPGLDGVGLEEYIRIKNLLWIQKDEVCRTALAEWDREALMIRERSNHYGRLIADLKNEIYQLIGFFIAFQGLVLTAVTQLTQTSPNHCGKVWSPVVLSGLAWIVAVVGVWRKFHDIKQYKTDISKESKYWKVCNLYLPPH